MVVAGVSSYCDFAPAHPPFHSAYHDYEYGAPVIDDSVLFERLSLEIMQAGLSWDTILKRRAGMFLAFDGFDPQKIATYELADTERLLADIRIIRNRLKVKAIINNARQVISFQKDHGSFSNWLKLHHPLSKESWVKLFRKSFNFMGPEIVGEFLMSIGYLDGAHRPDCPAYVSMAALSPPWMEVKEQDR